jgi:DNA-binding MarR family transcriptional regulator
MSQNLHSASPCLAAAMRAASRRLSLLYDEAMAPSGLRATQFHILSELERRSAEPPTVSELAEILIMERSALGQTLRPLERDGLVALGRDARDGRRRPVQLTSAGREAVARARPYWAKAHETSERFFGEAPLVELRTRLRAIAESPDLSDAFQSNAGAE